MKSDFLEKIIPIENEEKRLLIHNMSKLLDESIDDFINLRERKKNEIDYKDIELKMINKFKKYFINEHNNNNASSNRNNQVLNHASRLERIRNMEEETERLNRLIENDYLEIIG